MIKKGLMLVGILIAFGAVCLSQETLAASLVIDDPSGRSTFTEGNSFKVWYRCSGLKEGDPHIRLEAVSRLVGGVWQPPQYRGAGGVPGLGGDREILQAIPEKQEKVHIEAVGTAPDQKVRVTIFLIRVDTLETVDEKTVTIRLNATGAVYNAYPVWPGDTNHNRQVTVSDVFPISMYWGSTVRPRPAGSTQWCEQIADVPSGSAPNPSRADANGDGRVNTFDVLPIGLNWGKTW